MPTLDERIAGERDLLLHTGRFGSFAEADTRARARVAAEHRLTELAAILSGVTFTDLVSEAEDIRNAGGVPGAEDQFEGIDFDAALAERVAEDEFRSARAEYEAGEAYQNAVTIRDALGRSNPDLTAAQIAAMAPLPKAPERKAAAPAKAPEAPAGGDWIDSDGTHVPAGHTRASWDAYRAWKRDHDE